MPIYGVPVCELEHAHSRVLKFHAAEAPHNGPVTLTCLDKIKSAVGGVMSIYKEFVSSMKSAHIF